MLLSFCFETQSVWCICDMVISLLSISAVVTQMLQNSVADALYSQLSANHSQFVDFSVFVKWETDIKCFGSLLAFCVTIRLFRPLTFTQTVSQFLRVFKEMRASLISYFPLFILMLSTFSMIFTLLFSSSSKSELSFLSSMMALLSCLLGMHLKHNCLVHTGTPFL